MSAAMPGQIKGTPVVPCKGELDCKHRGGHHRCSHLILSVPGARATSRLRLADAPLLADCTGPPAGATALAQLLN